MAYIGTDPNMQQDQNEKDKQPTDVAAQPINVSGAAASGAGAGPSTSPGPSTAAGGAPATPGPTSSGRFQNLQNYLTANKGYNQSGGGLAGQVGTSLTGQEAEQEQAVGQESQRVQSEAKTAAQPFSYYTPGGAAAGTSVDPYLQQAISDPTKIANDPNALAQWQKYYGGQYTAPSAFDTSGTITSGQQGFMGKVGMTGSETGRMDLLRNLYGTPQYSVGQQGLDQLLIQSQPGQLSNLQQTAGNLGTQLTGAFNTGQTAATQSLTDLAAAANKASTTAKSTLGDESSGYIKEQEDVLQAKADQEQAARQAQYDAVLKQLKEGNVTADTAQELGLPSLGTNLYGVDPTAYLNSGVGQVGVGNIATTEDQAKFSALSKLIGQTPGSKLEQFATPTGPMASPYSYDAAALNQAISGAKSGYQTDLKAQQAQIFDALKNIPITSPIMAPLLESINDPTATAKNLQDLMPKLIEAQKQVNQYNTTISGQQPMLGMAPPAMQGFNPKSVQSSIEALKGLISKYNPGSTLSNRVTGNVPLVGSDIAPQIRSRR